MNFDNLYAWVAGIVIAFAATGRVDTLQTWVWKAQAHVLYESRTSTWGHHDFFRWNNEPGVMRLCNLGE